MRLNQTIVSQLARFDKTAPAKEQAEMEPIGRLLPGSAEPRCQTYTLGAGKCDSRTFAFSYLFAGTQRVISSGMSLDVELPATRSVWSSRNR